VNTAENADKIVMRIYIRNQHFKKSVEINLISIETFIKETLLNSIIRGIDNIFSTNCSSKIARTVIKEDDSIEKYNENVITTDGSNLKEIFQNIYINPYLSQSDSIIEIYELLGIEAARNKIIIELQGMMPSSSSQHYAVYGDQMTVTGSVSSIDKSGIEHREKNNILLSLANSHPLQGLEAASINSSTASCDSGLSNSLMVGQIPKFCSNYNRVVLNESFIQQNINDIGSQIEDL
jgi:DNA-directed RNA polymerase II subunit RPB1